MEGMSGAGANIATNALTTHPERLVNQKRPADEETDGGNHTKVVVTGGLGVALHEGGPFGRHPNRNPELKQPKLMLNPTMEH